MKRPEKQLAKEIAGYLMRDDFDTLSGYFAPWLEDAATGAFQESVQAMTARTRAMFSDEEIGPPDSFEIDDNPLTAEELREDCPSFPDAITKANFRAWCCVSILADDGEWSLYDLWFAIVDIGTRLGIGYYEVLDPD